jgi:hypothetical protein
VTGTTTCRSCGAAIRWVRTDNDRRMPVDAEPVAGGNVELEEVDAVVTLAHYVEPEPDVERYISRFATCPQAKDWRTSQ